MKTKLILSVVFLFALMLCLASCMPTQPSVTTTTDTPACVHEFSAWETVKHASCTEKGMEVRICELCGEDEINWLNMTPHTEVVDQAKAPTCTENGLTEGKHCSVCKVVLVAQYIVDAKGHTEVVDQAKVPTCTENGLTEGKHCSVCSAVLVPQETVSATGHTEVVDEAKAPTCTETGLTEGKHCAVCNTILLAQQIVAAHVDTNDDAICDVCFAKIYSLGLSYILSADKTHYIVSSIGTCTDTDIIIPTGYNGLPVKEIGSSAFMDCSALTSVTIGNGVTSIGSSAFNSCSNLNSVTIPDSVTSIGGSAFSNCDGLTSVTIPDSVTSIDGSAFSGCGALQSITVGESNTTYKSIDGNLYTKDGKTLVQYAPGKTDTSFTIPDSVTSIGDFAFSDCSSLTSVTIGDGVTSIGWGAFYLCFNLASVTIPGSVTSISDFAFAMCPALTTITVAEGNTIYQSIDGNLYIIDGKTLIQYAIGKTDTSFTIPDGVTSIGVFAFYSCTNLTSVTIPNSVTSIGLAAFAGCTSLTSVVIPDSVTSIGGSAFYGCSSLTSATFENTEGWKADNTSISSTDLANTATAAEYLRSTYYGYIWTRS